MSFSGNVWDQLKGITADKLIRTLKKDGWTQEESRGATLGFWHPVKTRIVVHYHPKKTYGRKLLKKLLDDTGWTENDMRRLRLIR